MRFNITTSNGNSFPSAAGGRISRAVIRVDLMDDSRQEQPVYTTFIERDQLEKLVETGEGFDVVMSKIESDLKYLIHSLKDNRP